MACGGWGTSSISSGETSRSNSSSNVSVGGAASVSNFGGGLGPLGGGLGPLGGGLGPIGGGLGGINNLEMRLRAGIEADRQCQAENCAKLKAVHTAATYEDFRQLVMGSQLRPLDRSDRPSSSSKARPSLWNSLASSASKRCGGSSNGGCVSSAAAPAAASSPPAAANGLAGKQIMHHHNHPENSPYPTDVQYDLSSPPSTTEGLVQLWGRLDLAERLELVRGLGGGGVEKLAGGLVAGGLLGDAITTLLAFTPTPGDVVMVVALLHALTQAKRFSLSVQLVCGEERWAWGRLLEKLQLVLSERPQDLAELNVTEWTIVQLKAKFNL